MKEMWDVAIVGGGPVGIFTAIMIARAGHSVRVIERDAAPYGLPRAVHIDHEMMRLFAEIGLSDAMLAQMRAGDGHMHIGADQGVIRFMSAAGKPRPFGYANDYFFNQPELETALRQRLSQEVSARLDTGLEVVELMQTPEHNTLTLSDGTKAETRWVIGCDGARSMVRKSLGIALDDLDFEEPWLVVDAEVEAPISLPDLAGVPEGANLQNLSIMLCDPTRPATLVPGRGNHRRWEFMLLPDETDEDMAAPEQVARLIAPYVDGLDHQIIRAATYRFHGLVAKTWRLGRALLAGDAAHQTPPFFGQGLCHGLRDGANIAWKLDLVLKGVCDDRLLDTYQTERDAQVRHVIARAIDAGRYICELDPAKAALRDTRLRADTGMKTAAELIAPIASEIVAEGSGERFINPIMQSGATLDEEMGTGWRLFCRTDPPPTDRMHRAGLDLRILPMPKDPEGHLDAWCKARGASCVLVRPDHYVAACAGSIDAIVAHLDRVFAPFLTQLAAEEGQDQPA